MGCLYCGKEIGAFRLLRGDEFCNVAHRQLYGERLGKALGRIRDAEPAPVGMAGFCVKMPVQESGSNPIVAWQLESPAHVIQIRKTWPFAVTPLLGATAKTIPGSGFNAPPAAAFTLSPEPLFRLRLPEYLPGGLASETGTAAEPAGTAVAVALAPREPVLKAPVPDLRTQPTPPPALRLRALQIPPASVEAPNGRSMADPPPAEWMPAPHPVVAISRNTVPSVSGPLSGKFCPLPPAFRAPAVDSPALPAGPRFQKIATANLATPAARAQISLAPMNLWRGESAALRYPDIAKLQPAEELLNHVRVSPPERFAPPSLPNPVELSTSPAACAFSPIENSEASKLRLPASLTELHAIGGTHIPGCDTPLLAGFVPAPKEPAPSTPGLLAAAVDWAPRELGTASVSFGLATESALAPFREVPSRAAVDAPSAGVTQFSPEISWPAEQLVAPQPDLPVRREAALAGPVPISDPNASAPAPAVLAFNGQPLDRQPGGHALQLPEIVHRPLWARPAPAPATQVRQFPKQPNARSRTASCAITPPSLRLPRYTPSGPAGEAEVETMPLVPRPVVFQPTVVLAPPIPITTGPLATLPPLTSSDRTGLAAAGFGPSEPRAAEPAPESPDPGIAVLKPISTLPASPAAIEAECTPAAVPEPSFIPIEYYCQRAAASPRWTQQWRWPTVAMIRPVMTLPLAEDRTEEPVARPIEPQQPSSVTEIFSHPEARLLAKRRFMARLGKIAACLIVGLFMWFGTRAISIMGAKREMASAVESPAAGPPVSPAVAPAPPTAVAKTDPAPAPEPAPKGIFARARQAVANRAVVEVADNLHAGMESWGSPAKAWAPGWARDAAGYVRPGALELFRPSQGFKDYRLEFFGQIENKAIGWVMRGRDKQNYYAMKFQVIQGGYRPVIAMVHYPVVDGRKGRRSETPLNVMVHHNEPFHVSVDVSGNRFTASIEGQKIETWTDDTPAAGAAGFFSEAGERARLYWMKVTKNDDWLGTLCGYLAGGSREVAEVWGPGIPQEAPRPGTPARRPDLIFAEASNRLEQYGGHKAARISKYRRNRWNS